MRTREDAIETARLVDPLWLERLLTAHGLLAESTATREAQSRRRDEAAAELFDAGVSYADIGRLLDVTTERVRQIIARHLGVDVYQLNPKPKQSKPTH
jgi:hypothetical protein